MSSTLIPSRYTRPYDVDEAHVVFFQHRTDRGGMANVVSIMIPEADQDIDVALDGARQLKARVLIVCDTSAQAQAIRRRTAGLLPDHREVALERAAAGVWGLDG